MKRKRIWTSELLDWVKNVAAPKSRTTQEVLEKVKEKEKLPTVPSPSKLQLYFKQRFGEPIGRYLMMDNGKEAIKSRIIYARLRTENTNLKKDLLAAQKESMTARIIKGMLNTLRDTQIKPPEWVSEPARDDQIIHGVPTLMLSDVHYAETVFPAQVNGANEYNIRVAKERLHRIFQKTTHITKNILAPSKYPGIVLACAGDLLSGNIHEELRETNELPIFDALIDLAEQLAAGIDLFKKEFGNVFIPWIVGNHGRLDKKPRVKNGPHDNYEYMLSHYLASKYKDDDSVIFNISDSYSTHFKIYNTRYLMVHGDQFRGGTGISGPILPWTLGDHRLRKQMSSIETFTGQQVEYDVLLFGHWHSYFPAVGRFVSNGSVKGFDEYAKKCGFQYEPPQQAFWLTSPDRGMTIPISIRADLPQKIDNIGNWISWRH